MHSDKLKLIVISPTDVEPVRDNSTQNLSPQSLANTKAAIDYYHQHKKNDNCIFFVMGGNGDTPKKTSYFKQKLNLIINPKNGIQIVGRTEQELIYSYLIQYGIDENFIRTESLPGSKNTVQNALKLAEFLDILINSRQYDMLDIKVFAWELSEPKIKIFRNLVFHSSRVRHTYLAVLNEYKQEITLEVIPVKEKIGNEFTNSQSYLRNEKSFLIVQVLAWLALFLKYEIPNEIRKSKDVVMK
jgi:hypothetical protein